MNKDLQTIYEDIKDFYILAKDAALIVKDLNIKNGCNIDEETKKYQLIVDQCNEKLEMIDIIFRYIILFSGIRLENKKPIDIQDVFDKTSIGLMSQPKNP